MQSKSILSPARDISHLAPKPNYKESKILKRILRHEGTGRAVLEFDKYKSSLSDYTYWFMLGTLWVSYTGWSDLRTWKRLFYSHRDGRHLSLMKPSEVTAFDTLPETFVVYRAKREHETDCIAYTLDMNMAAQWAVKREVNAVHCYQVDKADVTALFLRRGEQEVIILDQQKPKLLSVKAVAVV